MRYLILISLTLGMVACSNDNAETFDYRISLINLTNNQVFSPPAATLNDSAYTAWSTGQPAMSELEVLAEGGDATALVDAQGDIPSFSSSNALTPGLTQTFEISSDDQDITNLTLATMLVDTNDAFTGLTAVDLSAMQEGDVRVYYTPAYDAGTEFNDELATNIPGPAAGGEGFNADRDDVTGVVTYHGGVVGQDDGYSASALNESHRFDTPVMRIEVMRL